MKTPLTMLLASTAFVAALVGLLFLFDIDDRLLVLLRWVESQEPWAGFWFILIMASATVFLLPGFLFTTGAGFVFGIVTGTLYVVIGTTLGAVIAFLVARFLLGERFRSLVLRHSKLHYLTEEMRQNDLQVVLLTRLIPFFPGKVSNYFFGLSGVTLRGYSIGTFIGLVPFSLHNVYLGSLAASLTSLDSRQFGRTPLEWSVYLVGFIATLVAVFYLNRMARRALAGYSPEISTEN